MVQSILQSGLLSGLLTYYAKSQQFFPEIPPVFPDFFPDRTLINFFIFSWISLTILISISGKLILILSGLLTFYAQSENFFPDILPDFIPNRNLLNFFIVSWLSFSFLRFIFKCCCSSSKDSSNDILDYPFDFNDNYELFIAQNHIAHRADSYNPYSRRFNPTSQYGSNGRTARWSHNRAGRNNQIVRNYGLPY
ncbi:hypothetical protein RclHR1_01860017 [Rhizophagus clarus]|uniref:Uncharacterized protein n=1 Tax=Rhizophagus clarus TaxID=94130 RepID=A0A2Z6QM71_9GLOM|nr:hypothetical protein RclHR1_01860017 [Rhizophagus clarus]GES79494.1 hypothetical protein GLOIN_2v1650397 [Rhizophagus clarus]